MLEYLKCGIARLETGLREHNASFNKRLDDHEDEEREHRKLVWDKIGKISNTILLATGGISGLYVALKFFFKI